MMASPIIKTFAQLFKDAKLYTCAKGELLVTSGEVPRGVFYVREGYIKAYDIGADGELQVISIIGPNQIFPLYWALGANPPQPLFYETICRCEIKVLPKDEFKSYTENNVKLLKMALQAVLALYGMYQERIQNLELRTAEERLAFRLLFLAKYYGSSQGNSVQINMPVIYQDLADSISLTRETVNRTMRQFIADGIVTHKRSQITVNNPPELAKIIGSGTTLDI